MDRERLFRLLTGALVPLGLLGALFALATADVVLALPFAVTVGIGGLGYWLAPRYADTLDDATVDLTTQRTFVASLVQLVAMGLEFAFFAYLAVSFGVVTPGALTPVPGSVGLAVLAVLPGVLLGAGVPYLTQREVVFHRLSRSFTGRIAGFSLTFGTYAILLVAVPSAVVAFVTAYVASRILVLVGGQVWARR